MKGQAAALLPPPSDWARPCFRDFKPLQTPLLTRTRPGTPTVVLGSATLAKQAVLKQTQATPLPQPLANKNPTKHARAHTHRVMSVAFLIHTTWE